MMKKMKDRPKQKAYFVRVVCAPTWINLRERTSSKEKVLRDFKLCERHEDGGRGERLRLRSQGKDAFISRQLEYVYRIDN